MADIEDLTKELADKFKDDKKPYEREPRTLDELEIGKIYGVRSPRDYSTGWSYLIFSDLTPMKDALITRMRVEKSDAEFLISAGYRYYIRRVNTTMFDLIEWDFNKRRARKGE